jgi:hypothetical protein
MWYHRTMRWITWIAARKNSRQCFAANAARHRFRELANTRLEWRGKLAERFIYRFSGRNRLAQDGVRRHSAATPF